MCLSSASLNGALEVEEGLDAFFEEAIRSMFAAPVSVALRNPPLDSTYSSHESNASLTSFPFSSRGRVMMHSSIALYKWPASEARESRRASSSAMLRRSGRGEVGGSRVSPGSSLPAADDLAPAADEDEDEKGQMEEKIDAKRPAGFLDAVVEEEDGVDDDDDDDDDGEEEDDEADEEDAEETGGGDAEDPGFEQ